MTDCDGLLFADIPWHLWLVFGNPIPRGAGPGPTLPPHSLQRRGDTQLLGPAKLVSGDLQMLRYLKERDVLFVDEEIEDRHFPFVGLVARLIALRDDPIWSGVFGYDEMSRAGMLKQPIPIFGKPREFTPFLPRPLRDADVTATLGDGNAFAERSRVTLELIEPDERRIAFLTPAVIRPLAVGSGCAPLVSAAWPAVVERAPSGGTWREYRASNECGAIADSDRSQWSLSKIEKREGLFVS